MEREYIGGDVIIWRDNGEEKVDVERIGGLPGYVALTLPSGSVWLTPAEAKEVAKALTAYAEVTEKGGGYCHDPFSDTAPQL